jgi:RNA polymerase sigma-70 factor (ECF subfamily)
VARLERWAAPAPAANTTGDPRADAELVRLALAGSDDAFAGLVDRYQRRAFWIAFSVVGRVEEARDVVQEAFLRLHRSLPRYDYSRSFYTWFYRIVMNLAIDALRKVRASQAAPLGALELSLEAKVEPAGAQEELAETRALVWRVLERMDEKFRAVLVLRDIHGLSSREIAPILRVTHATVRWRLHRGRQVFRDDWERSTRGWHS